MTNKERSLDYILHLIDIGDKHFAAKAAETLSLAKSTIYNYVKELEKNEIICKDDNGKYMLCTKRYSVLYKNEKVSEDRVFNEAVYPYVSDLPDNIREAWRYAFTEMMNNAIEHSTAENIMVVVECDPLNTTVNIIDDGVGIFRKIKNYMEEQRGEILTLQECVGILFTGKFTTASENHSGEGIFFTSHLMDEFYIYSDKLLFTRNNFDDNYFKINNNGLKDSTCVIMTLSNKSCKTVQEIFDRYTNADEGFTKTSVPIAHMFTGGSPVSRSEARRLGIMISPFKEIILDFNGVKSVGQAFVHELFVVWQRSFPDSVLKCEKMNENVENMIKRVLADNK